jgi:hypothetical protein
VPQRLPYRHAAYAHARGRNGSFVPRVLEYEFSRHADGTLLVTFRVYSRREAGAAPIELSLTIGEWEAQALAIQLSANEERRRARDKDRP